MILAINIDFLSEIELVNQVKALHGSPYKDGVRLYPTLRSKIQARISEYGRGEATWSLD